MSQTLDLPVATAERPKPVTPGRRRLTWRECVISDLFGAWVIIGLFIDGWAHNHEKPETIFTPWHGILYSGFVVAAWWAVRLARRDQRSGQSIWHSAPVGHSLTLVGVIVFAIGATSDMTWHKLFGVEVSLAALLSPTHLLMLTGALLVMTGPFRAGWADGRQQAPSLREFLPTLGSLILVTALVAFFWLFWHDCGRTLIRSSFMLLAREAGATRSARTTA